MITVKNLRSTEAKYPWQIKVDRTSVLGNPYPMKRESERQKVIDLYNYWLKQRIKEQDVEVMEELERLVQVYAKHGRLDLMCWCAPKACHATSIKAVIVNAVARRDIKIADITPTPEEMALEKLNRRERMVQQYRKGLLALGKQYNYKPLPAGSLRKTCYKAYNNIAKMYHPNTDNRELFIGDIKVADGWSRLVIGDYGVFIEIPPHLINKAALFVQPGQEFRMTPAFANIKYHWYTTKNGGKFYHQQGEVAYADYKVGYWYICPTQVSSTRVFNIK